MYCFQCGEAIPDAARFCSQCGAKIEENTKLEYALETGESDYADEFESTTTFEPMENASTTEAEETEPVRETKHVEHTAHLHKHHDKPILTVKPRMVTWVILARYIPLQINLTFIGSLIFGFIVLMYHFFTNTLDHPARPFVFFAVFFFVLVPIVVYIAYRRTMDESYYEFYPDRLEYYEGFWTAHHKVLYYKHITDVTVRRNLIQRLYGMGTIHFAVPNRGPKYEGLFMSDIEHPVVLLDEIENIVRAY
ncbi:MAG: PH domain-containing protein [Legionellales bacterium]|nr:PH domain-containing protein [Legionellales bacterium]